MSMNSISEEGETTNCSPVRARKGFVMGVTVFRCGFFPPITRNAKLRADPLPWSYKPRAHLFFGLYSKAAPLERGNLIFWT